MTLVCRVDSNQTSCRGEHCSTTPALQSTAGHCRTLQDTLPDCLQPPRKTRLQSPAITGPQACATLRAKTCSSGVFLLEYSLNICFIEIKRHLSAGGLLTIRTVLTRPPVWLDHNVRDQGARPPQSQNLFQS